MLYLRKFATTLTSIQTNSKIPQWVSRENNITQEAAIRAKKWREGARGQ